jgi:mono/diheme cytochrome c family protein
MKLTFITAIGLFCALSLAGCGGSTTSNANSPAANNATANAAPSNTSNSAVPNTDLLARGRELYVKNCAQCHKESGEGGPTVVDGRKMKPDNLTDDRRKKLSDDKYIESMVKGIEDEGMPSFKDKLSEAEMREIVRYIRIELQKMPADQTTAKVQPQ